MKPVQLQSFMCIGTIGYEESLMHGSTNLHQYCSSKRVINLTFSISLVLSHVYRLISNMCSGTMGIEFNHKRKCIILPKSK